MAVWILLTRRQTFVWCVKWETFFILSVSNFIACNLFTWFISKDPKNPMGLWETSAKYPVCLKTGSPDLWLSRKQNSASDLGTYVHEWCTKYNYYVTHFLIHWLHFFYESDEKNHQLSRQVNNKKVDIAVPPPPTPPPPTSKNYLISMCACMLSIFLRNITSALTFANKSVFHSEKNRIVFIESSQ